MDELEISGKRYISTTRAGKDHNYHADYIGQLIRAKKVEGQKVGRSWYVEADSLAAYLGTEAAPRSADAPVARVVEEVPQEVVEEIAAEEVVEVAEPVEVEEAEPIVAAEVEEPVGVEADIVEESVSHIPVKISDTFENKKEDAPVFYRTTKEAREARGGLRYIADEGPLLPRVKKEEQPIAVRIVEERVPVASPMHTDAEEKAYAPVVMPKPRRTKSNKSGFGLFAARAGVVLVLGAAVFAVAAFASTHLIFTQTLDGGQTANAGYSLK